MPQEARFHWSPKKSGKFVSETRIPKLQEWDFLEKRPSAAASDPSQSQ
jgi:hypothetical protein